MRWMMLEKYPLARRMLMLLGFLTLGAAVFALLHYSGAPPKKRPPSARGRPVRVLTAKSLPALPKATGYGVVTAQREWQAIAQVSGAIVEMDENLEVGRVVSEGTRLFKIDPGSYELERSRSQATVHAVQAQVGELKAREESARATLDVEQRTLALARKDYERAQALSKQGLNSTAEVESAERGLLTAEKAVRQLENTIRELPASRRVLEAQLSQQKTGVEGARMDLARTEVVAPFTMRIRQLNASLHQVVGSGQVVLVGNGIDVMEVPAQFPVGAIGPLLGRRDSSTAAAVGADSTPPSLSTARSGQGRERTAAIQAVVRLKSQGIEATWNGTFRRFEGVDPATRTMGVVVEVNEPRRRSGGSGPPLLPGLYVEVELRGTARSDCLAIPRTALHKDIVYVVGKGGRLELRPVETELLQEQFVCVTKGLKSGDQVVLTELAPAVEGMPIIPRPDETAAAWLTAVARGETPAP